MSQADKAAAATALESMVDRGSNRVIDALTAQIQHIAVGLAKVEQQMVVITKLLEEGGAKKNPRAKAKAAETGEQPAAAAADPSTPNETAEVAAPTIAGSFPHNSFNWFTREFKTNEKLREKCLTPTTIELMKDEEAINKKKTKEEKYTPQAKWLWIYFKKNDEAMHKELLAQFAAAKQAHDNAKKPAAEKKEAVTP
jgi:hypothetical protein